MKFSEFNNQEEPSPQEEPVPKKLPIRQNITQPRNPNLPEQYIYTPYHSPKLLYSPVYQNYYDNYPDAVKQILIKNKIYS
jgi:hypothetical protein